MTTAFRDFAGATFGRAVRLQSHPLARAGAAAWRDVVSLLYPATCVICRCDAPDKSPLCDRCLLDLGGLTGEPAHPCCGKPSAGGDGPCPWCDGRGNGRIKRTARLGRFDAGLRDLVHLAKYAGRWEVADWLGDELARSPAAGRLLQGADVLVAVPLHAARQRARGYNQSDRVARRLGKRFGVGVEQPAARVRHTRVQASLKSTVARQANVRDAFVLLDPALVAGRHVVLVDDVTTSGATLRSLAHVLHAAGPASLSACVLAVADPRRRGFETT